MTVTKKRATRKKVAKKKDKVVSTSFELSDGRFKALLATTKVTVAKRALKAVRAEGRPNVALRKIVVTELGV